VTTSVLVASVAHLTASRYVRLSGDCFFPSIENAVGRPPPYLRTV